MKVEEIIEKDKVREVREDFYNGIMEKMARNKMDDAGPVIRKRHLGMSIAAGIALGILVGSIHHHMHKTDRQVAMQEWLGQYNQQFNFKFRNLVLFVCFLILNLNDSKLECIEDRLFN